MRKRLFVDNFAPSTTRDSLEELFRASGEVEWVTLPSHSVRDPLTHAFVVMSNGLEASKAIRMLNNTDWKGHRLTVTHAGPSPSQPTAGFSGGFGTTKLKNR